MACCERNVSEPSERHLVTQQMKDDVHIPNNYIRHLAAWSGKSIGWQATDLCSVDIQKRLSEAPLIDNDEQATSPSQSSSCTVQPIQHLDSHRDEILGDFQTKKLYLFLDYDGTLTPIVSNPWDAVLSDDTRVLLQNLTNGSYSAITVGIVTGRALNSVKNFVQIQTTENKNFIYAASHGFHIEAAGKLLHHTVGSHYIPVLRCAATEIVRALQHIHGVVLEDNEFSFSVHFRNTIAGAEDEIESILDTILKSYPMLKKLSGKKVFELRINLRWDKGQAVRWLLEAMRVDPFDQETRIVFIGDDLSDEDAFRVVGQFNNSLTVLVSEIPQARPTSAKYYVESPAEVSQFLKDIWTQANKSLES